MEAGGSFLDVVGGHAGGIRGEGDVGQPLACPSLHPVNGCEGSVKPSGRRLNSTWFGTGSSVPSPWQTVACPKWASTCPIGPALRALPRPLPSVALPSPPYQMPYFSRHCFRHNIHSCMCHRVTLGVIAVTTVRTPRTPSCDLRRSPLDSL